MTFKSKFEKDVYQALKKAGLKPEYEPVVVGFTQPAKERKYTPDFRIKGKSGSLFIETKGRLTREDRQKLLFVRESNPKLNLVLVFMNSSVPIMKGSPTTYADWAKKNNFDYVDFRFGLGKLV